MYINPIERPFKKIAETAKRKAHSESESHSFIETLEGIVSADAVQVTATDKDQERGEKPKHPGKDPANPESAEQRPKLVDIKV